MCQATGSSINRQWYAGNLGYARQVDQALDYVRARYLDVQRTRWLSPDAMLRFRSDAYSYARGRPSVLVDPSGRQPPGPPFPNVRFWIKPDYKSKLKGCGEAEFHVRWEIDAPAGDKPHVNGFIIQHVQRSVTVFDCKTNKIIDPPENIAALRPAEYWEAWPVLRGKSYDGYIRFPDEPDPYPAEDTFGTREEGPDTYGVIVFVGRAQFIEGYPMQPQRNMPPWGFEAPHGTLPVVAAPNEPIPPLNDDLGLPHVMLVRWNCCCGRREEFIYTEPPATLR
jgi:RHS repeat-associated protein